MAAALFQTDKSMALHQIIQISRHRNASTFPCYLEFHDKGRLTVRSVQCNIKVKATITKSDKLGR